MKLVQEKKTRLVQIEKHYEKLLNAENTTQNVFWRIYVLQTYL
jgi:hypothetical protein